MPTPSERLRKILNERLPELTELTAGCSVLYDGRETTILYEGARGYKLDIDSSYESCFREENEFRVLGHNASIYDIVRALPEGYALHQNGRLMKAMGGVGEKAVHYALTKIKLDPSKSAYDQDPDKIEEIIKLFN